MSKDKKANIAVD